ncbi:MAG: Trimethylamine methyltransferase (MTTB) [bacterium ADurb.Bin236]|nr:MAG: Trimethylamine methyltransferase (MTTB) [bacterium ADurb.Bin236]HOY64123.1 trimethylamine methyltransferase family protein [bacterium]HPN94695.1 trimethylamine methyltransferase family protein [bacterium]
MIFNKLDVVSTQEIERILDTSYRILEEVGFKYEWDWALELLEKRGCKVDMAKQIACVPRSLTLEAVANMKPLASPQDYPKIFWAPWIGMNIIDFETKTKRAGTLNDCRNVINLVNHLENISVSSTGVVPQDVPIEISDIYMAELLFKYSEKIVTTWTYTIESAHDLVEMAKAVTGGEDELRGSRMINYLAEPVSPLKLSKHSLEIMKVYGELDQPINMGPMVQVGTTGPATLAGSVALQMAENLAGLVYLYCLGSNSPMALGGPMQTSDMRTGRCLYAAPELSLIHLALVACAHHLGFMSGCTSGLTDSNCMDFQSGWDRGLSMMLLWAAGSESIGMRGEIGGGEGFCLESLVVENEMGGMLRVLSEGILVNDDTLALDVIEKVGIGGNYLMEKHTMRHARDFWQPGVFTQDTFDKYWSEPKPIEQRARERVEKILSENSLELQVSEDVAAEIDRIVSRRVKAAGLQ